MYVRSIVCLLAVFVTTSAMASVEKKSPTALSILNQPENSFLYNSLGQEVLKPKPLSERALQRILRRKPKPTLGIKVEVPIETRKARAFLSGIESSIPKPRMQHSDLLYREPGRSASPGLQLGGGPEFPNLHRLGRAYNPVPQGQFGLAAGSIFCEHFMQGYRNAFMFEFHQELRRLKGSGESRSRLNGIRQISGIRSEREEEQFQKGHQSGTNDGKEFAKAVHSDEFEYFKRSR